MCEFGFPYQEPRAWIGQYLSASVMLIEPLVFYEARNQNPVPSSEAYVCCLKPTQAESWSKLNNLERFNVGEHRIK